MLLNNTAWVPGAGAGAGAITGIATTPLDVVKTRLMTQGAKRTYSGVLDAFGKIWREEGAAAFLSVSLSSVRPTPSGGGTHPNPACWLIVQTLFRPCSWLPSSTSCCASAYCATVLLLSM